jgi:hypothetical protein
MEKGTKKIKAGENRLPSTARCAMTKKLTPDWYVNVYFRRSNSFRHVPLQVTRSTCRDGASLFPRGRKVLLRMMPLQVTRSSCRNGASLFPQGRSGKVMTGGV